jgi:hypothetical protein
VELWRADTREAVVLVSAGLSTLVESGPYSAGYGELCTAPVVVARGHQRASSRLGMVLLFDPGGDA